ncbi:MAG: hypothetical protein KatS3mg072_0514 [Meiothermus sp.]|nr:MAG: hypothetical protein KatS3mg072_0514 [Meiothermus sp.]
MNSVPLRRTSLWLTVGRAALERMRKPLEV